MKMHGNGVFSMRQPPGHEYQVLNFKKFSSNFSLLFFHTKRQSNEGRGNVYKIDFQGPVEGMIMMTFYIKRVLNLPKKLNGKNNCLFEKKVRIWGKNMKKNICWKFHIFHDAFRTSGCFTSGCFIHQMYVSLFDIHNTSWAIQGL